MAGTASTSRERYRDVNRMQYKVPAVTEMERDVMYARDLKTVRL